MKILKKANLIGGKNKPINNKFNTKLPNCLKKQNNKTTKITVKYKTEEKKLKV